MPEDPPSEADFGGGALLEQIQKLIEGQRGDADAALRAAADADAPAGDLAALQGENARLRALLAHVGGADVEVDGELNNFAARPDGSLVYVGERAAADDGPPAAPAKKKAAVAPRNGGRGARAAESRSGATARRTVAKMDDKQLMAALANGGGMRQFHGGGE